MSALAVSAIVAVVIGAAIGALVWALVSSKKREVRSTIEADDSDARAEFWRILSERSRTASWSDARRNASIRRGEDHDDA